MTARMRLGLPAVLLASAVLAIALAGCADRGDYTARFVRYESLSDGTRIAVVTPVALGASLEEQTAYTRVDDLEPGDLVVINWLGRSWDRPQWEPEREVVRRAGSP